VRLLASDELAGRATASEGELAAARHLARALESAGLEPGGTDGFLQEVQLERIVPGEPARMVLELADGERLEGVAREDFDLDPAAGALGPLAVRVARGPAEIGAPEAGLALFVDGSLRDLRTWLEAAGAPEGRGFGLVLRAGSVRAREGREARAAREQLVRPAAAAGPPLGRVHGALLEALRAGRVRTLALQGGARRERVRAFNVVGILRGAGREGEPEAARRALVLSAHFDHLGSLAADDPRVPEGGDRIYNGADDNASGTAAVLEVAEALALGPRPAHSLVVLLATGEERGLLGTEHYLEHPPWPLADTLYDLNLEMVGRPDELVGGAGKLWLVGWELSNVGPALAARGLAVLPDPRPEQSFFWRSDNVAFVQRGIVGQSLSSYGMHEDYHTPRDEAGTLDYEHLAEGARTTLAAARLILSGELVPAWAEGFDPATGAGR
jgi:hypothetical protein